MRTSLLVGLSLALTSALAVVASSWFDLQIESVALLGAATGAVLALVPDTTPAARLAGAWLGVVASVIGFGLRAGFLPDSAGGRAVAVVVVVALCTAVVPVTFGRVALWAPLLGAAAFAGAYERIYANAPAEFLDTSLSALTSLLVTVAVGFLATSWAAPRAGRARSSYTRGTDGPRGTDTTTGTTDLNTLLDRDAAGTTDRTDRMENAR